jgi:hypothetical protein
MNRRTFFRRALAALAGVFTFPLLPVSKEFVPRFIPQYVYDPPSRTIRTNPAWVNAPYEISFIMPRGVCFGSPPPPVRFPDIQSAQHYMKLCQT